MVEREWRKERPSTLLVGMQVGAATKKNSVEIHQACVLSYIWLFVTLWTVAHQAPMFRGFCKEEYWHGLSYPSLGDLPNIGMEPAFPALAGGFFQFSHLGSPTERERYTSHLLHSSIDRQLGLFHILAIVNNSSLNTGIHIFFWISIFVFFR